MALVSMTWPEYLCACCRIDGRLTRLRAREAELLCILLLSHPDRFLCREHFITAIWPDPDDEPETAEGCYLSVYMTRLRRLGIIVENRYHNLGPTDYGGWRIPREARGRPERVRLAA